MAEECGLYDAAGLGRPSAIVTALTWMVRDFQAEEEWPEMERPPYGRRRVALLLYDVCCCLNVPERQARELLGEVAWPRIRATFAPKGGPLRRTRVNAS